MIMKKTLLILLMISSQLAVAQWKQSSFKPISSINEVAFPSETSAYSVGDMGLMYKSTDGGANWTQLYDFGPFTVPSDLCFMNADTGFVNIYDNQHRTVDGGVSWTSYGTFPRIKRVENDLYTSYTSNDTTYIKKSPDLGNTWTTLFLNYTVGNQPYIFSIVDDMTAFFIHPTELDRVYKTTDGFTSIDTLFIKNGAMVLQEEFDFKDAQNGYHYGSWWSQSNPTRTWNTGVFYSPIDLDGFGVLPVFDLAFNTDKLYASSLYGKIYSSINNGQDWTEHATPINDPINSIAFYSNDKGIAISGNTVLYTSTGGDPLGFAKQHDLSLAFSLYPNPTNAIITLESPGFSAKTIEVYTSTGLKIQTLSAHEQAIKIDLSNFPSGVYFISLSTDGQRVTRKAVKSF